MCHSTKHLNMISKFHSDSISAIATSSCGRFVATGNSGVEPKVAIWRTDSCVIEWILPEIQKYSVAAIAFSPSNQYLAVVGGDDMHTLSIYCWKTDVLLSRCYCGGRSVLGVCFNDSESECVVFGHNLLSFAKNVLNGYPSLQRANFGDIGRLQIFLCCEHFVGFPTIGTGDGNFYIFQSGLIKHSIKAHIGAVNSLSKSADGKKLVSGGSDGIVRLWDEGLQCLEEFNILNITGSFDVVIRSVSFDMNGKNLLIATRSGDIFVIDADNSCMLGNLLVQGHGIKGLFGLATHPTKHEFATSGDDCTIRYAVIHSFI